MSIRLMCVAKTLAFTLALWSTAANAAITFTFDYSGAPDFNATSMAALDSAANMAVSRFAHTATINMKVTSSNANTTTLASAGSSFMGPFNVGFGNRGVVGQKILSGVDLNGIDLDGAVNVNFFHNWDFDDDIAADAFDFKSTLIHELYHAIGFSSDIQQNGSDAFGNTPGTPGQWVPFDQFVADSSGSLINSNFELDSARWNAASVGGTGAVPGNGDGLYFNGLNAMAANDGNPVPLYSPNPWEDGSSGSHTDTNWYDGTGNPTLIMNSSTGLGPGNRMLSAVEAGVFRDLGFTITAVPEPSAAFLMTLIASGFLRGRRVRRDTANIS